MVDNPRLSIVVPLFNEAEGLVNFHSDLIKQLDSLEMDYKVIYVNDGSTDDTPRLIREWAGKNKRIKLVSLSRNFGKENALAAGLVHADGQATLMLDGDGQHPVELIPRLIDKWQKGTQVVIGVRRNSSRTSKNFYRVFNHLTGEQLMPGSTDFRLIDSAVRQAFLRLTESDRITRGLIDWLGFRREYIEFDAPARAAGSAGYSRRKLYQLAANSFVSLTPVPLYIFGYLGVAITIFALLLGSCVFIEQTLAGDPWHWHFTGTAMIGILLLVLVGIILMALGMLSLYVTHIHSQVKNRPLYVIDYEASVDVAKDN